MGLVRKRQLVQMKQLSGEDRKTYLESLPTTRENIEELFVHLNECLGEEFCKHDMEHTIKFLMKKGINVPKMMTWLNENGGYCDCEILKTVEDDWEEVFGDA
jgi:Protein of unknown function (DUF2695)